MEVDGKAIEVSDVQWAKVMMKGVIQKNVVDGEVAWWSVCWRKRGRLSSSLRSFLRRWRRGLGVWEVGFGGGRSDV